MVIVYNEFVYCPYRYLFLTALGEGGINTMRGLILNPFVICSVEQHAIFRAYADRERWESECLALGATVEACRAFDRDALRYAATTLYPNSDVVAYARRLARQALARGEAMPASAEQAIEAENRRAMAALLDR